MGGCGQPSNAELAESARAPDATGDQVRAALRQLLACDAELGVSTAFDILAREPRIKPSRGLLIDPGDSARRRWTQRVQAGAALVESAALPRLFGEIHAELSESDDLAADVLDSAQPHQSLASVDRAALLALSAVVTADSPRPR